MSSLETTGALVVRMRRAATTGYLRTPILVATLFLGALALRAWCLGWGLPFVEHPDEPSILQTALRMVREGTLHPGRFDKPSLFFAMLAGATELYLQWGIAHGIYESAQSLPAGVGLFTPEPMLFIWNRAVTGLLGAATVPALYILGRELFGARTGLLAALCLMLSVFHLEHSAYITTDVPGAFFVVIALIGAGRILAGGATGAYALAGIGAGLAAGTKYNAGIALFALLLAHIMVNRTRSIWASFSLQAPILIGLACFMLAFFVATPFALLDASAFFGGLLRLDDNYGGDSVTFADRFLLLSRRTVEYGGFFWNRALFGGGCIVLLTSLPLLLYRRPRPTLLLLAVVLAELTVLGMYKVHFMRNVMAVYPLLVLLAAAGATTLARRARAPRSRTLAYTLLALALLTPQIEWSAWLLRYVAQPHTMAQAAATLRSLPHGMRAAVEMHPVQWSNNPSVFPVERLTEHAAAWYRANGFRYLVANDEYRTTDRTAYDALLAAAHVIEHYPPRRAGIQPGPGGALLDLGEHPEDITFVRHEATFSNTLRLLGYELRPGELRAQNTPLQETNLTVPSGMPLQINLYWHTLQSVNQDYILFIHIFNSIGERVAQRDLPPRYEDYPPSQWQPGELVVDRADIAMPPLPPGSYRVALGLYDPALGIRLPIAASDALPDQSLTLAIITVQ